MKKRITSIVGAGAILDFEMKEGATFPSTKNITDAVVGIDVRSFRDGSPVTVIKDAYDQLRKAYPEDVNFEMLFHVLEMYYAYGWVWRDPTHTPKNPAMFPVFAPFTDPKVNLDVDMVRSAIHEFLLKVMDIVNEYNAPFLADKSYNCWYRDFWHDYEGAWDVFNLNYDTTIENSLCFVEDGFEDIDGQPEFLHFNPKKLWENKNGGSTMSHLHGSIVFFDSRYKESVYKEEVLKYEFHDLYKYPSYDIVRDRFTGSSKSLLSNQAGEQLINSPIITGLRKNDKLNVVPFDFYHGHLYNCIMKSNAVLIAGYSFGDFYVNNKLERMELIHGNNKRVVLIDYWNLPMSDDAIDKINDQKEKQGFIKEMMEQCAYSDRFNHNMGYFLCRMTGETNTYGAIASFQNYDREAPMLSKNGCVMLFIGGFKAASQYKEAIYTFLNS